MYIWVLEWFKCIGGVDGFCEEENGMIVVVVDDIVGFYKGRK